MGSKDWARSSIISGDTPEISSCKINGTPLPQFLRKCPIPSLTQTGKTRKLLLFESEDQYGRLQPILGTIADGKLFWADPVTEDPVQDTTEVWEFYNTTEDGHPIHSGSFQIINRQAFTATQDPTTGALTNVQLVGNVIPPAQNERGWKDTAFAPPGFIQSPG